MMRVPGAVTLVWAPGVTSVCPHTPGAEPEVSSAAA